MYLCLVKTPTNSTRARVKLVFGSNGLCLHVRVPSSPYTLQTRTQPDREQYTSHLLGHEQTHARQGEKEEEEKKECEHGCSRLKEPAIVRVVNVHDRPSYILHLDFFDGGAGGSVQEVNDPIL